MNYAEIYDARNSHREGDFIFSQRVRNIAIKAEMEIATPEELEELRITLLATYEPTEVKEAMQNPVFIQETPRQAVPQLKGLLNYAAGLSFNQ